MVRSFAEDGEVGVRWERGKHGEQAVEPFLMNQAACSDKTWAAAGLPFRAATELLSDSG